MQDTIPNHPNGNQEIITSLDFFFFHFIHFREYNHFMLHQQGCVEEAGEEGLELIEYGYRNATAAESYHL